jgi:hypothetical protein
MAKNDLAFATVDGYRKILKQVWRPAIGDEMFEKIRYSRIAKTPTATNGARRPTTTPLPAITCAHAATCAGVPPRGVLTREEFRATLDFSWDVIKNSALRKSRVRILRDDRIPWHGVVRRCVFSS